jgi:hypothetical protein
MNQMQQMGVSMMMKTSIQTINPTMARKMLSLNAPHNRKLNQSKVDEFVRMMRAGVFKTTHQGIAFDRDGFLLDGQHRLQALIIYGFSLDIMVTTGADPETFHALDCGTPRSISTLIGEDKTFVAVCNFLYSVENQARRKLYPYQVMPYIYAFKDAHAKLSARCPQIVKKRSSSPIRAAAVVCMMDRDEEFAISAYTRFVRQDFGAMHPIQHDLCRWIADVTITAPHIAKDAFLRSLMAFDSRCKKSTVIMKDKEQYFNNAKLRIRELLEVATELENQEHSHAIHEEQIAQSGI